MSAVFKEYIKILGRGKKGARSLTRLEAYDAMQLILQGKAFPEQIGAFWMLIRIREETVEETIGFTKAARESLAGVANRAVDIDWPAYAGKRNELPWFLLAALTLSHQGVRILMHGHAFNDDQRHYVATFIDALSLPKASSLSEVQSILEQNNFCYLPLNVISNPLAQQMDLKYVLGLRSPVNTIVRMLNPFAAKYSVHGVFHTGYDELHMQAAKALDDQPTLVFRGGNGEAEVNPEREVVLGYWLGKSIEWVTWPKIAQQYCRQKNLLTAERMIAHWRGEKQDEFGGLAIRHTLASILKLIHPSFTREQSLSLADEYWEQRNKMCLNHLKAA